MGNVADPKCASNQINIGIFSSPLGFQRPIEFPSPKSESMTNAECPNDEYETPILPASAFGHSSFGFDSGFGFRHSDFSRLLHLPKI
jgi:hypothetical protein